MVPFCVYFGKEDSGESRALKQTNRIKTWESFRPELYESHHKGQHATHWFAYQALNHDVKKKFFDNFHPHANTFHFHAGFRDQPLSFVLHRGVIEVIIALALFVPEIGSDNAVQHYTVRIKNTLQFQLVAAHLSHGLSFRQVAAVLESSKLLIGVGKIGSISDALVSNFARILVAVNLTILNEILESPEALGFSIDLDSSTCRGVSYLAIRIRFHYKNLLHNIHVAAFPMSESHTAVTIYDLTVNVFNVLNNVLGIASDGSNVKNRRIGGVVTLLERDCLFQFTENVHLHYQKIAHSLRKQENLIREMGSKCPKMTTRWLALGSWSHWKLQHYEQLNTFFSSRRPDQVRQPEWYWPIVAAVFALFETVNRTMRALHNLNLLMTQQRIEICSMIDRIKKMTEMEGPLFDEELRAKHDTDFIGDWTISYESITGFLDDQGQWIHDIVANLSEDNQLLVKREVEQLITGFVLGVSRIRTIRDSENHPIEDDFPSLFPSFLYKLRGRDFGALLARYRERFAAILHQICSEPMELFKACENDNELQQAIQQSGDRDSFEEQWNINAHDGRFTSLRSFSGALFTVFPNTSSVESDFSVFLWEKKKNRESISNISLEGILQAKQFYQLQQLK
ncbi:hypothetical protein PsorP6_012624 [Peronosclerospora sorghi]|uniref:Uncharacterized protein n=1 Tax=Peronosclerospora sorghi TaxID=230839 RepID=A0ACC0WGK2_9STRA|nr:hypothetical protein PsorP6_012624 [Peronosclerospora sorghi]